MNKPLFLLFALLFVFACDTESELKRSIFIPDPDDPELPQYSEWGYNTFGAYYDRVTWTSNEFDTPAKITVNDGMAWFTLNGDRNTGSFSSEEMSVTVSLPGFDPETYNDLVELHATTFDLTDPQVQMGVMIGGVLHNAEVLEGKIEFVRAQLLKVDGREMETILSGKFECKLSIGGEPVTLSKGRFDVGVGDDNFFRL